tara:strand:+ start:35696 stop:36754 length:1059 start_codon:yes stop_codon:yes gene_type:complete
MYKRQSRVVLDTLTAVPKVSIAGATGITTFIKHELVGDNGAKPAVTPPVKFKRSAAQTGLRRGRQFDSEFQAVVRGQLPVSSNAAKAVRALYANGVHPVKCQYRVQTDNKLTTLIDCVGIQTSKPFAPVVIELKTCQMPLEKYEEYCKLQCRRTPMMRCTPSMPNTERSRHCIQAAYGAIALQPLFADKIKAMVLVLCSDGVAVYDVPRAYFCATLFTRLTRVATNLKFAAKQGKQKRLKPHVPVPPFHKWGPVVNKAARKHGLTLANVYTKQNVRSIVRGTTLIGVAAYSPDWYRFTDTEKAHAIQQLQTACKRRHKGYVKTKTLSLIIATTMQTSPAIQFVMASRPFCVK